EYPMLMEYSQGDTLFLRADTIKTYIISELVAASRRWTASGFPEKDGIPVLRASDGIIWLDSMFFSLVAPLSELPVRLLSKVAPMQASSEKGNRSEMPRKPDPFKEMAHEKSLAVGDSADSVALNERRVTEMQEGIGTDSISGDSIPLVPKEFHIALAYHRARFFKQDLQGVADSMVVVERDSMMYMFRKPIVWSGERQVTGNRIDIHFNDSTADWALLPESGMLSEHVDEDFYNQLGGKKLLATFANQTLNTLDVSGNVEMIFLPQESDSTYNRLVAAESSYLTLEMDSGRMSRLKMWPEVSGTVTPLFLVKKQQQYLRQFRWWESLRPVREWYGDRWHWQDNLGEVPEDLDRYFEAASDFGVPKSFPQFRPVSVPASGVTLTQLEESEAELEEENKETEEKSKLIEKAVKKEETENEDENNKEQQ
ncbi:MAG: hypothetical protein K2F94_00535, partial [Muribaculaceae bacterium]|nr:hypothetical protein [Muribaculaceae bacterium]